MNTDKRLSVQETLDEPLTEQLIPFALTTQKVSEEPAGNYLAPFMTAESIRLSSLVDRITDCLSKKSSAQPYWIASKVWTALPVVGLGRLMVRANLSGSKCEPSNGPPLLTPFTRRPIGTALVLQMQCVDTNPPN
jgi:hypothetical protein